MGIFDKNVIDITHHSKRTQAGNIAKAGTSFDVVMSQSREESTERVIPKNVTIESAILYFRKNANGDNSVLYQRTAEWLEKYRVIAQSTAKRILSEAEEEVLTVNLKDNEDSDNE